MLLAVVACRPPVGLKLLAGAVAPGEKHQPDLFAGLRSSSDACEDSPRPGDRLCVSHLLCRLPRSCRPVAVPGSGTPVVFDEADPLWLRSVAHSPRAQIVSRRKYRDYYRKNRYEAYKQTPCESNAETPCRRVPTPSTRTRPVRRIRGRLSGRLRGRISPERQAVTRRRSRVGAYSHFDRY
jgi:hypothetical protein